MEIRRIGVEVYKSFLEDKVSPKNLKKGGSSKSSKITEGVVTEISISSASQEREERIKEIKFLIESGLYKIDLKSIAENLIEELIND
ncbi:flagellar biosynthesis anti-sigma factor FlgM [Desulfurobacterium crinifex]